MAPATDELAIVAAVDLNGDGRLDLVTANYYTAQALVLLGNGDGTFGAASAFSANISEFVIGDFNADGFMDLAYIDTKTGYFSVLPGKSDGTFGSPIVSTSVGGQAFYWLAGDFNNDGKLDLAITYADGGVISIVLGNGDGTFKTPVNYAGGINPYGIVVADFNGDGNLDVAVTNSNDAIVNTVSVFLGNGDGTLKPYVQFDVGTEPGQIVTGDLDGDGKLDLIVLNTPYDNSSLSVLFGNGDGTFEPQVVFPVTANWTIVPGDFNNDGRLDLAIADRMNSKVEVVTQIPSVNLAPTSLSFPNQEVGITGATQPVTLTNASNTPLQIYSIALTGTNNTTFTQTNTCPATLNAGGNCTISIAFAPPLVGTDAATLTVTDSGAPGTQTVALSGSSVGPVVSLSKMLLGFGNEVVGTVTAAQMVTLANTGTVLLTISSLLANGDYKETNTCGSSVGVGGSCTITVRFKPVTTGILNGAVTIKDNAGPPIQIVKLFGIGTDVSLSTTSLAFLRRRLELLRCLSVLSLRMLVAPL